MRDRPQAGASPGPTFVADVHFRSSSLEHEQGSLPSTKTTGPRPSPFRERVASVASQVRGATRLFSKQIREVTLERSERLSILAAEGRTALFASQFVHALRRVSVSLAPAVNDWHSLSSTDPLPEAHSRRGHSQSQAFNQESPISNRQWLTGSFPLPRSPGKAWGSPRYLPSTSESLQPPRARQASRPPQPPTWHRSWDPF